MPCAQQEQCHVHSVGGTCILQAVGKVFVRVCPEFAHYRICPVHLKFVISRPSMSYALSSRDGEVSSDTSTGPPESILCRPGTSRGGPQLPPLRQDEFLWMMGLLDSEKVV